MTRTESSDPDRLSRAELAVVLQKAADLQARTPSDDGVSRTEAEALAREVGISVADFRKAARALRAQRRGGEGWLGPAGALSAETTLAGPVRESDALHMLSRAQVELGSPGGTIETPAAGLWRLSDGQATLLQISARGDTTALSAALDRRRLKVGLLAGGGAVGAFLGALALPAAAMVLWGSVGAVAIGNVVGIAGGAVAGSAAGAAAWKAAARRTRARLLAALDRMRSVADDPVDPT